jgi:8-oxo-dGTP diphosphatase
MPARGANQWDLPGGGREGDETPLECALRELHEEFGLRLPPARVHWNRAYGAENIAAEGATHFFVATLAAEEAEAIVFGDEGQHWALMPVQEFLTRGDAIAHLQQRLRDYFASQQQSLSG